VWYKFAILLLANGALGLAGAHLATRRGFLRREFMLVGAISVASIFAYVAFYIHVVSLQFGRDYVRLIILAGVGALVYCYRQRAALWLERRHWLYPLGIMLVVAAVYGTLSSGCSFSSRIWGGALTTKSCLFSAMPEDNYLPYVYAKNVVEGHPLLDVGGWQLADRPPLQDGAVIEVIDGVVGPSSAAGPAQLLGILLQLSWIPALWGTLLYLNAKRSAIITTFILTSSSGFAYLNSVFVWPKLLSAAFLLPVICLFLFNPKDKPTPSSVWYSSALFLALALLAHDAIVFTVVPLLVWIAYRLGRQIIHGDYREVRHMIGGVAILVLMLAPWLAYKSATTHGDRLIKYQLAGVTAVTDQPTIATLEHAYSGLSVSSWLLGRGEDVVTLVYADESKWSQPVHGLVAKLRQQDFYSVFFALGLGNIGLFAAYYFRKRDNTSLLRNGALLVLATFLFWIVVLFVPRATIIIQGSYAAELLLFIIAGWGIAHLPSRMRTTLISVQIVWFLTLWVFSVHR
jgi:hypothetical protein